MNHFNFGREAAKIKNLGLSLGGDGELPVRGHQGCPLNSLLLRFPPALQARSESPMIITPPPYRKGLFRGFGEGAFQIKMLGPANINRNGKDK